ncbi:response regulator transcription factor [aff. Roholtiella sp. LEGE 12411]|uniref:response regulator transcription factor n=1 Tax=aff. Roholtiella sp. LEGE 12411 TaxID=1828822 RepID=UPI00187E42FB|nr:response regulator [aff. Roholtiella sp. LEGE 12411]MBE9036227.1 response regulator [aff. Roholtiella sp. LEGE 12411]
MATILIIDDAAFSRRMLRKYLQIDGYEILEAVNGQEGLEMIKSHQPNCVLTDLLMPDINGFELLKLLKQENLKVPAIIISADIQDSSRQQGMELGAVGFINKPAKEDEVRQAVRQIFA